MLKTLTEINAVSGDEDLLAEFIVKNIKPYATDIKIDTMGNVIAFKKGRKGGKLTHMLAAHMDEVGFIITKITENGFLKFEEVGGISDQILLTQRVEIGENKVKGILGVKAVHLQSKDERESLIKKKNMYIDIGAKDKADAEKRVKIGDYATFCSKYTEFGTDKIKAKALDDRVGVYTLLELIKDDIDFVSIDVSFISLRHILPVVYSLLSNDGLCVALIKPQFEAGREEVGKKGVVRDKEVHKKVILNCLNLARLSNLYPIGLDFSPIKGPEGNIEFLMFLSKNAETSGIIGEENQEETAETVVNSAHTTEN